MKRIKNLKITTPVTTKLDPKRKELLIEALLSGKYEQGQGQLCVLVGGTKKYCCLGVGADISPAQERVQPDDLDHALRVMEFSMPGDLDVTKMTGERIWASGTWSRGIAEWFGTEDSNIRFFRMFSREIVEDAEEYGGMQELAEHTLLVEVCAASCNDELGLNFAQIADLIRFFC